VANVLLDFQAAVARRNPKPEVAAQEIPLVAVMRPDPGAGPEHREAGRPVLRNVFLDQGGRVRAALDVLRQRVAKGKIEEAEKVCPCCQRTRVRIGSDVSERLDYRPAALFVRQVVRPTYACRACERAGNASQVVRSSIPP